MTCCIAALCEKRRAIVLVADRMLGAQFAQAELRISKIQRIHPDWCVMIAGNNIGPAFDILDKAGTILQGQERNVVEVQQALATFYREKRLDEANASGDPNYKLQVTLLAAGFDQLGVGHLFRVSNPGICARRNRNIGEPWRDSRRLGRVNSARSFSVLPFVFLQEALPTSWGIQASKGSVRALVARTPKAKNETRSPLLFSLCILICFSSAYGQAPL